MTTITADPAVVRQVVSKLATTQTQITSLVNQINAQISTLHVAVEGESVGAEDRLRQLGSKLTTATQILEDAQKGLLALATDVEKAETDAEKGAPGAAVAGTGGGPGGQGRDGKVEDPGKISGENKYEKKLRGEEEGEGEKGKTGTANGKAAEENGKNSKKGNGEFNSSLQETVGVNGSLYSQDYGKGNYTANVTAGQGELQSGFEVGKDGMNAGIWGSATALTATGTATFLGNEQYGMTTKGTATVGQVSGFAGVKNDSLGADVGVTGVDVSGSLDGNIAGHEIGVNAGVGLELNFGFQVGKHTEVNLGIFHVGFDLPF